MKFAASNSHGIPELWEPPGRRVCSGWQVSSSDAKHFSLSEDETIICWIMIIVGQGQIQVASVYRSSHQCLPAFNLACQGSNHCWFRSQVFSSTLKLGVQQYRIVMVDLFCTSLTLGSPMPWDGLTGTGNREQVPANTMCSQNLSDAALPCPDSVGRVWLGRASCFVWCAS